jgi:hypothetical protein
LQRRATTGRQVFDRPAVQRFRAVLEDPATREALTALGFKN